MGCSIFVIKTGYLEKNRITMKIVKEKVLAALKWPREQKKYLFFSFTDKHLAQSNNIECIGGALIVPRNKKGILVNDQSPDTLQLTNCKQ